MNIFLQILLFLVIIKAIAFAYFYWLGTQPIRRKKLTTSSS